MCITAVVAVEFMNAVAYSRDSSHIAEQEAERMLGPEAR